MFNTGDTVSYGTSGVCTIAEKNALRWAASPTNVLSCGLF